MSECERKSAWRRPCRFEPRYDLSPVQFPAGLDKLSASGAVLDRFRSKTYCGDVCVTCGKTVHPMGEDR
jgi:hypothetical protein